MSAVVGKSTLLISFVVVLTAFRAHHNAMADLETPLHLLHGLLLHLLTTVLGFLIGRHQSSIRHWISLRRELDNSDPETCRKILNGTVFDGPIGRNYLTPTESRARPNQRLIRAFAIDNGFTTFEDRCALAFKRLAAEKLRNCSDWTSIARIAEKLVKRSLEKVPETQGSSSINDLVQSLTLKLSIGILFDRDPLAADDAVILEISTRINDLWLLSKDRGADCARDLQRLHQALRKVQLDIGQESRESPLNLILPAYETLWRIVLRCFLEVSFRSVADSRGCDVLTAFLKEPTSSKFTEVSPGDTGVSASFLVNEALRLYPPTRRIHRELHLPLETSSREVAANIEACHRRESIWGPDSRTFVPSRWTYTTPAMRVAFMPFGGQPFVCPAKPEFGPKMIGLLVAALATHVSPCEWDLASLDSTGLKDIALGDEPLDSGRNAYGSLVLLGK